MLQQHLLKPTYFTLPIISLHQWSATVMRWSHDIKWLHVQLSSTSCKPPSTFPIPNIHNLFDTHTATTTTLNHSTSQLRISTVWIYERVPAHVNKKLKIPLEILDVTPYWALTVYFTILQDQLHTFLQLHWNLTPLNQNI